MKSHLFLFVFLCITISCAPGLRGVYFSEMTKEPTVEVLDDQFIAISTENSHVHSALKMYKIDYSIDPGNKVIRINGFQSIRKGYGNRIELRINGLDKAQLADFDYVWVDPDGTITKIAKVD